MVVTGTSCKMTRGDTEQLTVYVQGRPFVTGDIIELTMRKAPKSSQVLLHKEITDFSENEGKAVFHFEPEDTNGIPWGKYSYDVQATFQDIGIKTIIKPSSFTLGEEDTYDAE